MLAKGHRNVTTISTLSDNALLEIFDRFREQDDQYNQSPFYVWEWHLLVHVCRRWRRIIFASPRRLNLQLLCTYGTPVSKIMDIWPTIPVMVLFFRVTGPSDEEAVITALEHSDRVSRIKLFVSESQLGKITALMLEPFPVLTHLSITSESGSTLPDRFLGGSALPLQQLDICNIVYPALPTLLSSANNLIDLSLRNTTPPAGYVSPEALVTHVAALLRLEILDVGFTSFLDPISSHLITRTVLPALRKFTFSGSCKYLEDFISRIDTPQLNSIVVYYESGNNFDVTQLTKFVDRPETLKRSLSGHCEILLYERDQNFVVFSVGRTAWKRCPKPGITVRLRDGIEGYFSHLTNIDGFMAPLLSHVVHCTIHSMMLVFYPVHWSEPLLQGEFAWLQFLRQLSSVQTLFVSNAISSIVSELLIYLHGTMITEVLPALKLLCLENKPTPSLDRFLAARRDAGHPVTFIQTKEEFEEKLKSYP